MSKEIQKDAGHGLTSCPACGARKWSQGAGLLARDRVHCDNCKLNFRRQDLQETPR